MFIYHFNRLIRNRVLWIIFALIVAFAFLSVDSCTFNPRNRPNSAGLLGKTAIDDDEFAMAERMVSGGRAQGADYDPLMVETQAWQHLAALQTANRLGLASGNDEVRQSIRETPAFSSQGEFDVYRFQQLVMQSLGVDVVTYQRMVADQLSLGKLYQALAAAALVTPMELDDEVAALTDNFTVQYATISNEFLRADMELDDAALQRYYHENLETFTIPDRVAIHYARVAVTNYVPLVTIHDDDILDYYEMNSDKYTRPSTNETAVTLPLEEVRDDVIAVLALEEARYAASTNLAAFMETFTQCDYEVFRTRSRARRFEVFSTDLFSADQFLPQIDFEAQDEFRESAFDLDQKRLDACYTVVTGNNYVYLLMAGTNSPSHTSPFEDERDRVLSLATEEARETAFANLCTTKRAELLDRLTNEINFTAAATACGMQASTSLTFSAYSAGRAPFTGAQEVIPAAIRLRRGELSEPLIGHSQSRLIYVQQREPGDSLSSQIVRPQIRANLQQRRASALIAEWQEWNLKRIGFAPNRPLLPTAAVDEAEYDDDY